MVQQKENWALELLVSFVVISVAVLIIQSQLTLSQTGSDVNYRNATVRSTVNITNSLPQIIAISIDPNPITLIAGGNRTVTVNVTVRDFEGFGDISLVNATFFDNLSANFDTPDDNNYHYTNASCTNISGAGNEGNWSCVFPVRYYANNGSSWVAIVIARDNDNQTTNESIQANISILLAVNVTNPVDYGNMAVGDTSTSAESANVTNFGNVRINVSVYGYGNQSGDGLAMLCEQNNITISNERYSVNASLPWASMTALTGTGTTISNWQVYHRTNDTDIDNSTNSTYWTLNIPIAENPAGECNGSIVFQAEQP